MDPQTPSPPPEARLIRIARQAAGLTAADAARATQGVVSGVYWRDIERGYGGRRGIRARTTASARVLAHMAAVVRVSPERLRAAGRADAAEVLEEIRGVFAVDSTPDPDELALADLVARHPDDDILRRIAERGGASAATRRREADGWVAVHYRGNGTAG